MRKISKPLENAGEVFIECISIVRNADLKARLTACKELIIESTKELDKKVTKGEIYTINREIKVNGNLTAKELEDVYTLRMAKKETPGRAFYDKLISRSPQGICPLCSHRVVSTIDHYLPKTQYPRLSVSPINLVPSCMDCNKVKSTNYPTLHYEETIHPYYDDIENDLWLKASVLHTTPPSIQFKVMRPNNWSSLLYERVNNHFKVFSINNLYSIQSAVELVQINYRLNYIYSTMGSNGVRSFLLESAETRSHAYINSWQAAMYMAVANDKWFCNGGFKI